MAENNLNDVYAGMEASRQAEAARAVGNPNLAKQKLDQLANGELPPAPPYEPGKVSLWRKILWMFRRNRSSEKPNLSQPVPASGPNASPEQQPTPLQQPSQPPAKAA